MASFLAELRQQPTVLTDLATQYTGPLSSLLGQAKDMAAGLTGPVVFAGMGSSNWAAEYAAMFLAQHPRPALVREAGELLHYGEVPPDSLLILISQSGESAETAALARKYAGRLKMVAVTNNPQSTLGRYAPLTLPLMAGPEEGTTNKTFVATLAVLGLLSLTLTGASTKTYGAGLSQAARIMAEQDGCWADEAKSWYRRFVPCQAWSLVARGYCVGAADQGALIVKEMAGIPVEGYAGGTFRHGPLELAGPEHGVVVLAPAGKTRALGLRLAYEAASLGSPTLLLTDAAAESESDGNPLVVRMPALDETLAPYIYIVPLEHLAVQAALAKGYEPGVMRRAQKVTNTE